MWQSLNHLAIKIHDFLKSTYLKLFHILMLRVTLSTDKPHKKGFRDVGANSAKPKPLKTSDINTTNDTNYSVWMGKHFRSWYLSDFQTWKQATNNSILMLFSKRTGLVRSLLPLFRRHVSFWGGLKRKGTICFSDHHSPDTGCHSQNVLRVQTLQTSYFIILIGLKPQAVKCPCAYTYVQRTKIKI